MSHRNIRLTSSKSVNWIKLTKNLVNRKLIIIIGKPGSGKTVLMRHLLYLLKDEVYTAVLFDGSPYSGDSKTFSDIIPPALTFQSIADPDLPRVQSKSPTYLSPILARQEVLVKKYAKYLLSDYPCIVARKLDEDKLDQLSKQLFKVEQKFKYRFDKLQDHGEDKSVKKLLTEEKERFITSLYQQFIINNMDSLRNNPDLTKGELNCLNCIKIKPGIAILMDDCAGEFESLKQNGSFNNLFIRHRHNMMTPIIALQTATYITPRIRSMAGVIFMTTGSSIKDYIRSRQSIIEPEISQELQQKADAITDGYQVFMVLPDDPTDQHYYYTIADDHEEFQVGLPEIRDLCNVLTREDEL